MSALRIPAISPAGAKDRDWCDHFLAYATALDDTGFPRAGSFGIGFNCFTDLSVATSTNITAAIVASHPAITHPAIASKHRQVTGAYAALTPGALVALKKGKKIVAFVRVGPYTYDPSHVGDKTNHPHRWNYEVVRKTTAAEEDSGEGNLRLTFVPDSVPLPADLAPAPAPATGGAGTSTSTPVLEVTDRDDTEEESDRDDDTATLSAPATKAELLAMRRDLDRRLAEMRAARAAELATEKARKAERAAAKAARAAAEAARAAARSEKATIALTKA